MLKNSTAHLLFFATLRAFKLNRVLLIVSWLFLGVSYSADAVFNPEYVSQIISCNALSDSSPASVMLEVYCPSSHNGKCNANKAHLKYLTESTFLSRSDLEEVLKNDFDAFDPPVFTLFVGMSQPTWDLTSKNRQVEMTNASGSSVEQGSLYLTLIRDSFFPLMSFYRSADSAFSSLSLKLLTGESADGALIESGGASFDLNGKPQMLFNHREKPVYNCFRVQEHQ